MKLSENIIEGFIRIYRDEFGEEITRDQAREAAARMVTFYRLLLKPLPDEGHEGQGSNPDHVSRDEG